MEWVLQSPQIHSTFGSLGFVHADGYHINENCNAALDTILHNILTEDKYLRSYRRSISFGENIKKDLIPLLIHAKDDKTIELLIRILVNLTIPVECLLSVEVISKTDFGRHTVFEINNLLYSTKLAFTDHRATKVIIDFFKKNIDVEQPEKLSPQQCTNISNCLLLLRNILHIPEDARTLSPNHNGPAHSVQNQILWNIFSQSVDKILIKLMTIAEATNWGVTMVQLIALLYKDQHVVTLHKLLNLWLEASLSESSEDNESNTSPPDRGSDDSSPMLTSDPTSDSSDTGGSGKINDELNSEKNTWNTSLSENNDRNVSSDTMKSLDDKTTSSNSLVLSESNYQGQSKKGEQKIGKSETSDCGYGTQIENQESISTSSNEDELPTKKPIHQKPHNSKQRINNKVRSAITLQERKRKKVVKRGKANIINVQGLSHSTPTDDDISNVLKEFTVDFLLKGYNALVQTLHSQILTNLQLEIDTSHFFWLVTYFLKFATQIELDLEHICSVLSFDIVSYLTAEGVNLCEQFELAIKLDGSNLKPSIRRLHLVVTAIREFVQAIEVYKKGTYMCSEDQDTLAKLQIKMCETEELRSLLVLLLRHYNPKYHTKQYLQDLIVTNHILLMFVDSVMKLPDYKGSKNMIDHIKQFATPKIMYQYGLLLEDYESNGEFVNDCIFTIMHHVGGELGSLISLFQPKILKTFTSIWKSEFEICDDWSDLVEYVINTFIKKPHILQSMANFRLDTENFDDDQTPCEKSLKMEADARQSSCTSHSSRIKWSEDELSSLSWNYMQCNTSSDVVGEIVKLFKEDGITKPRNSVIKELFKQNLIKQEEFERCLKCESDRKSKSLQMSKEIRDDEIGKLCEQLIQDGKANFLDWVQKVLLDTCCVKIYLDKKAINYQNECEDMKSEHTILNFELFKKKSTDLPVMSPVSYHSLLLKQSVPLVPWNCEQADICKDLKFLQLLHKLGFNMPVDTGKVLIRIPHFWTADVLYEVAGKISPIDTTKLKFSLNDLSDRGIANSTQQNNFTLSADISKDITSIPATPNNFYQIHKQRHPTTMVNFTPMPGSSFNSDIIPEDIQLNNPDWLQVAHKSQDCKIILKRSNPEKVIEESGPVLRSDSQEMCATEALLFTPIAATSELPSAAQCQMDLSGSEDSNSACETASVISDLTRMYVSDEDEKSDVIVRPIISPLVTPLLDDPTPTCVDSDNERAGKRARLQSPTF